MTNGRDRRKRTGGGQRSSPLGCDRRATWPALLAAAFLSGLVAATFYPILRCQFLEYDVSEQVVNNPYIRGLTWENLAHIFTSRCINSYYPFRTLTFAVDYQVWGLNPTGFERTNGLVHLANVLLVFWLVMRLFREDDSPPGSRRKETILAALAAGLFAVHPVVVEPVAWICGREELLMTLGALGCLHFHISARRLENRGASPRASRACHAAAAACCAVACLSNAVGAVIPLLITARDLLSPSRPTFRAVLRGTAALWAIGFATVVLKKLDPDSHQLVRAESGLLSMERLALVFDVYGKNVRHLVWPVDLACNFGWVAPRSLFAPGVILGGAAAALTGLLVAWLGGCFNAPLSPCGKGVGREECEVVKQARKTGVATAVGFPNVLLTLRVRSRRESLTVIDIDSSVVRHRRMLLLGLTWFLVALAPTSQIMPHHIHRADRFLYLPLVGIAIALAVSLRPLIARQGAWRTPGFLAAGGGILLLLSLLSHSQTAVWRDDLALWTNTLRVESENPVAHASLARHLFHQGKFDESIAHFEAALRADPDNIAALNNYSILLSTCPEEHRRDFDKAIQLAEHGWQVTAGTDADLPYTLALASVHKAAESAAAGRTAEAIRLYERAIDLVPERPEAMANLSFLLATCPQTGLRDPARAVALAEQACAMSESPDPYRLSVLAAAYASASRFDDALTAVSAALHLAQQAGDARLVGELKRQASLYTNRNPYQDSR